MLMKSNKPQQLIVFLKPPIEGLCKSRLIPLLGRASATRLYRQMVIHCMDQLQSLTNTDIHLCIYSSCDADTNHPFINELRQHYRFTISTQQGDDLGQRMHNAINESLHFYQRCVLIGTDCPEMNAGYIESAFKLLEHNQLTFGPACDGGYVLVGCSKPTPEVFENIQWSTPRVLQQTLDAAQRAHYPYQLLTTLWDVDTPADYIQHYSRIKQLLKHYSHISEPQMRLYHEPEAG